MTTLQSEELAKIVPALIAAQAAFAPARKDATNPAFRSKYVTLEGVLDAVTPALRDNKLALVQQTDRDDDGVTILLTRLIHESGEWLGCRYPVRPVKADPQGEGSALTYARRYSLMSLVGIAPEDDDGNAASPRPAARKTSPPFDVSPLEKLIDTAATKAELEKVAVTLKATKMPEDAHALLVSRYRMREQELTGDAA